MALVNFSKAVAADVAAKGLSLARVRVVDGKIEVRPTARSKGKLPAGEALFEINFRTNDSGEVLGATVAAKGIEGKASGLVPSKHGWLRMPVEAAPATEAVAETPAEAAAE